MITLLQRDSLPTQVDSTRFIPGLSIVSYGRCPSLSTSEGEAMSLGLLGRTLNHGCLPTIVIKPPNANDSAEARFVRTLKTIDNATINSYHVYAYMICDGIAFLSHYDAVSIIQSRDCPKLVVRNILSGSVAIVHVSRDFLLATAEQDDFLSFLIRQMASTPMQRRNTYVYISNCISGEKFKHDANLAKVQPFFDRFGREVFADVSSGALDLVKVIRHILTNELDIVPEHIGSDGLCTYDDPRLGSYRAGKSGQNYTLVVPHN